MITTEKLLEITTKKQCDIWPMKLNRRIYDACCANLISRRDHIVSLIRTNYWVLLEQYISAFSRNIDPIKLFALIRQDATQPSIQLYNYLTELYAINDLLKTLDENVESRIEYCEHIY